MLGRPGDETTAGWLLTCSQEIFDLEAFRRSGGELNSWRVSLLWGELAANDPFVLWLSGPRGGVVARGSLTSPAHWEGNPDPAFWAKPPAPAYFVPLTVERWLSTPIPARTVRTDPTFATATIVTMPGGRNPHRLSATQWDRLANMIDAIGRHGQPGRQRQQRPAKITR
ncbi:hypothetical protein [Streptomyces eurythermus]|uniref:hypothetical protein n=1 Tax=Streptomyces eurythermus TaxID=42237 RepID=UPI0036D28AB8